MARKSELKFHLTTKEIKKQLPFYKKFCENLEYLGKNSKEIKKKYGGRTIIIVDKKIIESCRPDEFDECYKKLESELDEDKLRTVCITYILKPDEVLML